MHVLHTFFITSVLNERCIRFYHFLIYNNHACACVCTRMVVHQGFNMFLQKII
ncbi:hypothetical protein CAB17_20490 [Legionella sainthelensi]|nr:hypothetical protein CAB17_20490 [Legionella sainthelensi]